MLWGEGEAQAGQTFSPVTMHACPTTTPNRYTHSPWRLHTTQGPRASPFRYRQSSEGCDSLVAAFCMQLGGCVVALRTSVQGVGGVGGAHLRGGAAKGIPRKLSVPCWLATPGHLGGW